jgi:hypothetical protein
MAIALFEECNAESGRNLDSGEYGGIGASAL